MYPVVRKCHETRSLVSLQSLNLGPFAPKTLKKRYSRSASNAKAIVINHYPKFRSRHFHLVFERGCVSSESETAQESSTKDREEVAHVHGHYCQHAT